MQYTIRSVIDLLFQIQIIFVLNANGKTEKYFLKTPPYIKNLL